MTHEQDLICQDDRQRRADIRRHPDLNGLDYLEIADQPLLPGQPVRVWVYFLDKAPEKLTIENIRITGGQRITDLRVIHLSFCREEDPDQDDCMVLTLNHPGDLSTYRLCIIEVDDAGRPTGQLHPDFDIHYACLDFSFQSVCPNDLDCAVEPACETPLAPEPEINYLARDYAGFRQLILDRLAVVMPDWTERHVPDQMITLVEMLAYTGDYLSYYQDAVATEAYLETARRRISVRRHVRLVDYFLHEGCNARAWLCIQTGQDIELNPDSFYFITGYQENEPAGSQILTTQDLASVPHSLYEVFEPLAAPNPLWLYAAHSTILFYTWGDQECCLPAGSTRATLLDGWEGPPPPPPTSGPAQSYAVKGQQPPLPDQRKRLLRNLRPGAVLIFTEQIGPETGSPADADPRHRCAVRLTRVEATIDRLYDTPVVEIEWDPADALPFALCISARPIPPECQPLPDVSVACGNVILVDHGRRVDEPLGCVPVVETSEVCETDCDPAEPQEIADLFRPVLQQNRAAAPGELTFSQPLAGTNLPASSLLRQDPRKALPWITMTSQVDPDCPPQAPTPPAQTAPGAPPKLPPATNQTQAQPTVSTSTTAPIAPPVIEWRPQLDLLSSSSEDAHFVVEMENDRRAHLRFGNGVLGRLPDARSAFQVDYRLGNGAQGNVGAETICHMVFRRDLLSGLDITICNPMPAHGGLDPEPLEEARQFAPYTFRLVRERAITAEDYVEIVMRDFSAEIQRAAAVLRWMGSWYEVLVAVDPRGSVTASPELLNKVAAHLEIYRRIGHAVVILPAEYVPLEVQLDICLKPNYIRGHAKAALLAALGSGRGGFFNPDQLTFGEGVALSRLVSAAQAVAGVESVTVRAFQRMFEAPNKEIENGFLPLGPLEIAQLDNNPNLPENGKLTLKLIGGR
jgi:hypothetical protein